jgi:hypothetical protein
MHFRCNATLQHMPQKQIAAAFPRGGDCQSKINADQ